MATGPCAVKPPTARVLTAVVALCLGLAACGGTGGSKNATSIRDFRLIEVGKTHLQIAADGRSAVLQVETNPPTVCAIAYGRTAALGSIADDPNMGGTAISRHTVLLGGLAPATTYRFLLTATDAQGRVFSNPRADHLYDAAAKAPPGDKTSPSARGSSRSVRSGATPTGRQTRSTATSRLSGPRPATVIGHSSRSTSDDNAKSPASPLSHAKCRTARRSREHSPCRRRTKRYGPFPAGNRLDPHIAPVSFTGPIPSLRGRSVDRREHGRGRDRGFLAHLSAVTARRRHPYLLSSLLGTWSPGREPPLSAR